MFALMKKFLLMLAVLALFGCYLEEHEVERGGHSWSLEGVKDDSTAVVKVVYWVSGTIHDHHLMGWDDDFYHEISKEYFAVRMTSYWRGRSHSSVGALLPADSVPVPEWCDSCGIAGMIDDKVYGVEKVPLDSFSAACALVLVSESKILDSLELENCDKVDLSKSVALEAHYLRVNGLLYEVREGKFPRQTPVIVIQENNGSVRFSSHGEYVIYGGEP